MYGLERRSKKNKIYKKNCDIVSAVYAICARIGSSVERCSSGRFCSKVWKNHGTYIHTLYERENTTLLMSETKSVCGRENLTIRSYIYVYIYIFF